ncbi:protein DETOXIFICATION 27-like [Cryptomeria japonica]|uniref:protein DETOXIFICATION 27-like n=1 Tax=Cryptomeria japonica TaxID=3369 RepID=UPI0027DA3B1E|nr:protein DETOXIFICATION 27-like [Cryptomeria japonica]
MADSLQDPLIHDKQNGDEEISCNLQEGDESGSVVCSRYLGRRIANESKKIWAIAGPAIFSRMALYGTSIVSQAFVGHLGELELAAFAIATTVIVGFNFGLFLGMASALETICGQAFGVRQYHLLGLYMQRAWIVLFGVAILLLPMYIFATPILKILGQSDEIAELTGKLSIWLIPLHFAYVFYFPAQRFFQTQLKNMVIAWISAASFVLHVFLSWLFIFKLEMGLIGSAITLNLAWWMPTFGLILYATCGVCPRTWTGLSRDAFSDLWAFFKLSAASGVMLCLESWYYRILVLLTGNLPDSKVAIDSLSICMSINGFEMMIPLGFFAATGVRVANELGAGNGKGAKFAVIVSAITSTMIGLVFCLLIILLRGEFPLIFTSSTIIIDAVSKLSLLLGFTVLLNSIQPVLSGVAVGSGWQSYVAYINIGCYYVIGVPFGVMLCWMFKLGVLGIWTGMICGTAVQTIVLAFIVYRCDWDKAVNAKSQFHCLAAEAMDRVNKWSPEDSS